jgi:[NiFe] hydrogenase assembly HybE family chaperone
MTLRALDLERACAGLVAGYARVAARDMSGLPGYNPRLSLDTVGFREWEGHGLGVLVAPWFMNLVLLPGPADDWSGIDARDGTEWHLPTTLIQFHPCHIEGPGLHLTAPLFTDLRGFPDQATARSVAVEVMRRLFEREGPLTADAEGATRLLKRRVSRRGLFRFMAATPGEEASDDA